jgi:hypothetical protein
MSTSIITSLLTALAVIWILSLVLTGWMVLMFVASVWTRRDTADDAQQRREAE